MRAALILMSGAALFLGACSNDGNDTAAQSTAPVIAPGRPGEAARTLSPGEAVTAVPSPVANAADVRYAQNMVIHHRQALDMAALAPSRFSSPKVKGFADRILAVQGPEIRTMTTWLTQENIQQPGHHTDHTNMPGMATPEQLDALRAASGADFDRLFLQLMINHHEGAITMATDELTGGSHLTVQQWAQDVIAEQTAEIHRMQEIL
ncbi:lipoprotein [Planotetraspora thailandica]|uniref:Lipoprotein n=1 Tax=Planotetraspora thailandica TaxID=487172 RepID=A0A8J3V120_9ACTN|nr:DUF305 domain-containing protein [Planotetraspora thailandica]GII55483.1 lipoprotein [Planotetraspora thailandica]